MDGSNTSGTFYGIAFLDLVGCTQQNGTHIVFFKVKHNSANTAVKFDQFIGTNIGHAIDPGNAIAHLQYCSDLIKLGPGINFPVIVVLKPWILLMV